MRLEYFNVSGAHSSPPTLESFPLMCFSIF